MENAHIAVYVLIVLIVLYISSKGSQSHHQNTKYFWTKTGGELERKMFQMIKTFDPHNTDFEYDDKMKIGVVRYRTKNDYKPYYGARAKWTLVDIDNILMMYHEVKNTQHTNPLFWDELQNGKYNDETPTKPGIDYMRIKYWRRMQRLREKALLEIYIRMHQHAELIMYGGYTGNDRYILQSQYYTTQRIDPKRDYSYSVNLLRLGQKHKADIDFASSYDLLDDSAYKENVQVIKKWIKKQDKLNKLHNILPQTENFWLESAFRRAGIPDGTDDLLSLVAQSRNS